MSTTSVFSPLWKGIGYALPPRFAIQCDEPPFGGVTVAPKWPSARMRSRALTGKLNPGSGRDLERRLRLVRHPTDTDGHVECSPGCRVREGQQRLGIWAVQPRRPGLIQHENERLLEHLERVLRAVALRDKIK